MQAIKRKGGRAFVCLSLILLLLFSALHLPLLTSPVARLLSGEIAFSSFAKEVHATYVSRVFLKNAFVDLNGAYARLTGRRVYHGVSILNNGMLDRDGLAAVDTAGLADGLIALSDALAARGIAFLYVQIPSKLDVSETLLADGVENAANRNADAVCAALTARGAEVLDLRGRLVGSVADVERYYYRTDHHWNADGAFCAFGEVLERLSAMLPDRAVDTARADARNWRREVYADWMLGSHGKRVGCFFGGVDDLILYTPKGSCVTRLSIPHKGIDQTGEFLEVLVREEYLDRPDYFGDDAHCVYLGGNYPLAVHENSGVGGGAHVLLVKDSFSLPLEAMLSTALSRLDTVDPRYFRGESVLEYAERTRPDLVAVAINPSVFSDGAYLSLGA